MSPLKEPRLKDAARSTSGPEGQLPAVPGSWSRSRASATCGSMEAVLWGTYLSVQIERGIDR